LDPQLPGVFTGLGRSYLWRLDFEAAEAAFRQQQAHRPDPEAQWSLAVLTAPMDLAAAREMLSTLPAQAPPDLLARRDYLLTALAPFTATSAQAEIAQATGIALAQVQLWPLAVQALTIAREQATSQTAEEQAETLAFLAYALTYTGRPTLELFEEARTLDPTSALPLYFYGIYLRRQGALNAAEEALQQALQLDPENAAIYVELAQTEAQRGNLTLAEDYLSKAAIAARNDLNIQLLRVKFYALRGYRLEEAGIPAAEALITVDKDNAELYDLLGWMQFLRGDNDQAERSLRRALELDPNLTSARYHLARYLANQGDIAAAATEYQRVIDLDTSNIYRDQALAELQQLTPGPQE
jgi:tetratricopeptide (TPR) repeat protein